MIDTKDYALAQSFEELKGSGAFQSLMNWLHENVLFAESEAAMASPTIDTRELRNRFIAWQERRKIELAFDEIFAFHARNKQEMDEELKNERAVEHERATRSSW